MPAPSKAAQKRAAKAARQQLKTHKTDSETNGTLPNKGVLQASSPPDSLRIPVEVLAAAPLEGPTTPPSLEPATIAVLNESKQRVENNPSPPVPPLHDNVEKAPDS